MTNKFMNALTAENSFITTENGATAYSTSGDKLLDMFALGGAYRSRSDVDCVNLFKNAYEENPTYALKCLFYLRDILEGQGERRFFRIVTRWLAHEHPDVIRRNLKYIPEYGRYDDLYVFIGTPVEEDMWNFLRHEIAEGIKIIESIKE